MLAIIATSLTASAEDYHVFSVSPQVSFRHDYCQPLLFGSTASRYIILLNSITLPMPQWHWSIVAKSWCCWSAFTNGLGIQMRAAEERRLSSRIRLSLSLSHFCVPIILCLFYRPFSVAPLFFPFSVFGTHKQSGQNMIRMRLGFCCFHYCTVRPCWLIAGWPVATLLPEITESLVNPVVTLLLNARWRQGSSHCQQYK